MNFVIGSDCLQGSLQGRSRLACIPCVMNTPSNLVARVHRALDEGRLLQGILIHSESRDPSTAAWHLATKLPAGLVTLFRKAHSSGAITSQVVGRDGSHFSWIIGYQARRVQHRFVLPLVGNTVEGLIEQARHFPVGLLLHTSLNAPFHEAHASLSSETLSILSGQHQPIGNEAEIIQEHATTLAEALDPAFVDPAEGRAPPTKIYVSSVLPPELAELMPAEHFGGSKGDFPPMLRLRFVGNA